VFTKESRSGAAAGTANKTDNYIVNHSGKEYTLSFTLLFTNLGNFDPSIRPDELDQEKESATFEQILSTFRFIEKETNVYDNIPKDAIACEQAGGSWGPGGLLGAVGCVLTYPDAGEVCESSDDCLGTCLVANASQETGTCKKTTSPFGCHLTIENARAGLGILCAD